MKKNTQKIFLTTLGIITVIVLIALAINNLFGKDKPKSDVSTDKPITHTHNSDSKSEPKSDPKIVGEEAKNLLAIGINDLVLGDRNAPLTIVEYASLSCPHCASFYSDGFSKLKDEYISTGKVKFVYRDFPLNQPALVAGMLALCQVHDKIADVAKYYDFVKVLFKTQESWAFSEDFALKLETIAKLDGVSSDRFSACIKDNKLQDQILKSRLSAAQTLQIQSTPTFFVGSEMISGYGGYGDLKNVIEKKLQEIANPTPATKTPTNGNK
jgi:protein-disulfide isomerase